MKARGSRGTSIRVRHVWMDDRRRVVVGDGNGRTHARGNPTIL